MLFSKNGENDNADTIKRLIKDKNINIIDNEFCDAANIIIDFIKYLNNI